MSESSESADDDISILSTSKQPGQTGIDDEDGSDSDYSAVGDEDPDDSLHSSEDDEEERDTDDNHSSSPNEDEPERDPEALSKAERKRRRKEKKRRKKERKRRRKEKKEKKRKEKEAKKKSKKHHKDRDIDSKKDSGSMTERAQSSSHTQSTKDVSLDISRTSRSNSNAKLEDGEDANGYRSDTDSVSKKRQTITKKIKKIGAKLKKGLKDKDDRNSNSIDQMDAEKIMKVEDERSPNFKIRANPLNKTSTQKLKEMFKTKTKKNTSSFHHRDDSHLSVEYNNVIGKEEELTNKNNRPQTSPAGGKRKKKSKNFIFIFIFRSIHCFLFFLEIWKFENLQLFTEKKFGGLRDLNRE